MNQQNNTSNNDADFASIEEIIAAIGRGELVVMVDDEDRENEGDLIMAAQFATAEKNRFHGSPHVWSCCCPSHWRTLRRIASTPDG